MAGLGADRLTHAEVREALRHLGVSDPPAHRAGALRDLRTLLTGIGTVRGLLERAPERARTAFVRLAHDGPATVEDLLGRGWWGHGLLPEPLDWLQRRGLITVDDGTVHVISEARQGFAALTLDLASASGGSPARSAGRGTAGAGSVSPAAGLQVSEASCVVVAAGEGEMDRAVAVSAAGLSMVAPTVALSTRSPSAVRAALRSAGLALADDVNVTAVKDRPALPGASEEAVGPRAVRALIGRAVEERRQIRLQYFASSRGGAATDRVVDPWAFRDDLLSGWCHLRTGERTFAVDRMGRVRLLPDPITHLQP